MGGNVRYDDFIKAPNLEWEYTPDQIRELNKCKNDVLYFISNYIKIVHQDLGVISFEPYDYQVELINNFINNRFNVCLLSRQSGKCVHKDSRVNIRNKLTGEIKNISIKELFDK